MSIAAEKPFVVPLRTSDRGHSQQARAIVLRAKGRQHGPITRLVSPSDVGELIKPFVFLDRARVQHSARPLFGIHPHSGIATLTVVLAGAMWYEDTTGKTGQIQAGGLEWMKAGGGVWHDGGALPGEPLRVFQLWVALPASQENSQAESQYVDTTQVEQDGPVRVVLGSHGLAHSLIRSPAGINYFHVRLRDGERWRYLPPTGHTVGWLAVDEGRLQAAEAVEEGELAVFAESEQAIEVTADGPTSFVVGTAIRHPHRLVLGQYSVHTSEEALRRGEAEIERIGKELRVDGGQRIR
jgi:redox-sensitive bicupin YhaK (pirin superfamily)